jgi:outer membrane protein assembly factor BamE (lipoprotein component of BamABCDE complex)
MGKWKKPPLLLVFSALFIAAGITLIILDRFVPKHQITADKLASLQVGMTEQEVNNLFGVPAGNYCGQREYALLDPGDTWDGQVSQTPDTEGSRIKRWIGDKTCFEVEFDNNQVSNFKMKSVVTYRNLTIWELFFRRTPLVE